MNNPWSKILVFGLLFGIAGFFIGRCTGSCGTQGCEKGHGEGHGQMACCNKDGVCEHGGTCCQPGGHCDKPECAHMDMMAGGEHGKKGCCKGEGHGGGAHQGHGDEQAQVIIQGLEKTNFQGDTTVKIDGGTVNVKRTGEKMEVRVEMRDSSRTEETSVEVHTH
jgi:hypothetical protein